MKKTKDSDVKWVQKAKSEGKIREGGLHKSLGIKSDKKIPAKKIAKAAHSKNTKIKKQAVLAQNFAKMRARKRG